MEMQAEGLLRNYSKLRLIHKKACEKSCSAELEIFIKK